MSTIDLEARGHSTTTVKPYKGIAMEGPIARWYAKIRDRDPQHESIRRLVAAALPAGGRILEVAPGPGYLAIELARQGNFHVVGLDISKSFVQIAQTKAREAGVSVDFRHGNASAMPFAEDQFDFIVCVAAFKNFTEPVQALREMHRVLKPGGKALVSDLRRNASGEDIRRLVDGMGLNPLNKLMTAWTFKLILLRNAYTRTEVEQMVAEAGFAESRIIEEDVSMEVWLRK
jgi:ubiquinone/menaquinone biosynthesis C-methylase UbiE